MENYMEKKMELQTALSGSGKKTNKAEHTYMKSEIRKGR